MQTTMPPHPASVGRRPLPRRGEAFGPWRKVLPRPSGGSRVGRDAEGSWAAKAGPVSSRGRVRGQIWTTVALLGLVLSLTPAINRADTAPSFPPGTETRLDLPKSKNSAVLGRKLKGHAEYTVCSGEVVYTAKELTGSGF